MLGIAAGASVSRPARGSRLVRAGQRIELTSDYVEANDIRLPTRRRAYTRRPDRRPILEMPMVSIDISEVRFE